MHGVIMWRRGSGWKRNNFGRYELGDASQLYTWQVGLSQLSSGIVKSSRSKPVNSLFDSQGTSEWLWKTGIRGQCSLRRKKKSFMLSCTAGLHSGWLFIVYPCQRSLVVEKPGFWPHGSQLGNAIYTAVLARFCLLRMKLSQGGQSAYSSHQSRTHGLGGFLGTLFCDHCARYGACLFPTGKLNSCLYMKQLPVKLQTRFHQNQVLCFCDRNPNEKNLFS